ncbi:MAG: 50S ribosomal protein L13 [Cyanobacteria bacterium]|jgi:large subunit ribosomal protein L13|nr:50S ribosomal protein L13 [Cyanobacteriota bacterium]
MKTYSAKPLEVERKWWIIDAEGKTLGRLATLVSSLLRGKHKPQFTPHIDTGDFVIVLNADKIHVTGKKPTQKFYYRNTGYPGGLRKISYRDLLAKNPDRVIEKAVKGMLQHNTLGRQQFTKLFVYAGPEHPHGAQKPAPYVELEVVK